MSRPARAIMTAFDRMRGLFALPAMSADERADFHQAHVDERGVLMVPTVVIAVLLIAGFVGWDQMRDLGHLILNCVH